MYIFRAAQVICPPVGITMAVPVMYLYLKGTFLYLHDHVREKGKILIITYKEYLIIIMTAIGYIQISANVLIVASACDDQWQSFNGRLSVLSLSGRQDEVEE